MKNKLLIEVKNRAIFIILTETFPNLDHIIWICYDEPDLKPKLLLLQSTIDSQHDYSCLKFSFLWSEKNAEASAVLKEFDLDYAENRWQYLY